MNTTPRRTSQSGRSGLVFPLVCEGCFYLNALHKGVRSLLTLLVMPAAI